MNKKNKKINNTPEIEYKSANLMLNYLQKEYEYDLNNLNGLYSRVGIIIAFTGIYIGYIFTNLQTIKGICELDKDYLCFIRCISFIAYILCLLTALLSLLLFFRVILTDNYRRLKLDSGFDEKTAKMPIHETSFYLMITYKDLLVENKLVMRRKFKIYKNGIIVLLISLVFFIISLIEKFI